MKTVTLLGTGSYPSRRPPNYAPGVVRCQWCKKTFPRTDKKKCPYCKKIHGNEQAR